MFKIRFFNELGEVTFGGGSSQSLWRVTAAEGLTFTGKSFSVARYIGQDGQETNSVVSNARTITISGDVVIGEDFERIYSSVLKALSEDGVLEITTYLGKRVISARCCEFKQVARKGKYLLFTVQFICDNPYFEDAVKTEVAVFAEVPLLEKNFTFPGRFSRRISRSNLEYLGTAKTEPTFVININEGVADGENSVLAVYNHTSGEAIKFNYSANLGECVTIDIKNRKIYNSDGENLIRYLSDESFFDGFFLYPGINVIEVLNGNMNTGIDVMCRYANRFSEAVIV